MDSVEELKECPFCGGNARIDHGYTGNGEKFWVAWCVSCEAEIGDRNYKEEAIEAWNRRA